MEQQDQSFLERLIKRRGELFNEREVLRSKRQAIVDVAKDANREQLNDEEDAEFRTLTEDIKRIDSELAKADTRIEEINDENERSRQLMHGAERANTAARGLESVNEKATYQKGDPRRSYLQDMVRANTPGFDSNGEARERLQRHAQDVAALPEYDRFRGPEYRDLNRTDGTGGYAVPPAWLMDQYISLARAGRPFANLVTNEALPAGTNSINIPKLLTGTATAIQTADNAAVQDTDLTDTFVQAQVTTIAGQQGLAIQLLDQSPIAFDQVVFRDLIADHASKVDQQVLFGAGSGNQVQGVNGTSGILSVATGGLTVPYTYAAVANAIQQIHTQRFLPPTVIVMHPRRWGWLQSLLDTTNRPLFPPVANNPMNAAGLLTAVASQQVVGELLGLPVVTDPNISVTSGSPANQDYIYVMRADDLILFESGLRTRVLPETKAANLTVLLQVYSYLAFTAARYPQSVAIVTGFTPPTWGS